MLRTLAAAAFAAVAVTAAPAYATLNTCQEPADVNCYSTRHEMHCQVYFQERCANLPASDGPICAFHPICDDIHELIKDGSTRTGS